MAPKAYPIQFQLQDGDKEGAGAGEAEDSEDLSEQNEDESVFRRLSKRHAVRSDAFENEGG